MSSEVTSPKDVNTERLKRGQEAVMLRGRLLADLDAAVLDETSHEYQMTHFTLSLGCLLQPKPHKVHTVWLPLFVI